MKEGCSDEYEVIEAEKTVEYLHDRWSSCVGCKYNGCKKKENLEENDYQDFSCSVDLNDFPCERIPELYPYKFGELKNKDDESVFENKVAKNAESRFFEAYLVDIHDDIEYNIRSFVAVSDDIEFLRQEIKRKLGRRVYRHLKLFNIKKLSDIFKNYNIVAVPKDLTHIYYPDVDLDMEHGLSKIKMKEMVIDIKRFPSFENGENKSSNIEINMDLSNYDEVEKIELPKAKRKRNPKPKSSGTKRRRRTEG